MLIDTIINHNSNLKSESLYVARHKGVIIDFNHSRAFSFEDDMSNFRRLKGPLCECGCGEKVKWCHQRKRWNKYIYGHHIRGKKCPRHSERMKGKNNPCYGRSGKRNPMFGMTKEKSPSYGIKRSKKFCENQSERMIKNNPMKRPEVRSKIIGNQYKKDHKHTKDFCKNQSNRMKGNQIALGTKHSKEFCENYSKRMLGPNNPNWKGGIAAEPYCDIWLDQEYKNDILLRDNNECQNPDCWKTSNRLCGHHIDYDKKNCHLWNVITLCISCNSRANINREDWQKFYQNLLFKKSASI